MNKLILISVGAAISFGFAAINYAASGELRAVQSGELTLVCAMKDDARVIDPKLVVDFVDGVWVFNAGSAKNCEVIKGGEL